MDGCLFVLLWEGVIWSWRRARSAPNISHYICLTLRFLDNPTHRGSCSRRCDIPVSYLYSAGITSSPLHQPQRNMYCSLNEPQGDVDPSHPQQKSCVHHKNLSVSERTNGSGKLRESNLGSLFFFFLSFVALMTFTS